MKSWFGATLLACFVLVVGLIGIDKMIDRMEQSPRPLHEDTVNRMVDALMAHPRYLEYLEDEDGELVKAFTNAMMEHPAYQTTPEEDCATVILMAAVMSGDYALPPDSDVDRLCAWYLSQSE